MWIAVEEHHLELRSCANLPIRFLLFERTRDCLSKALLSCSGKYYILNFQALTSLYQLDF
jgi:hypothetical protein